MRGTWRFRLVAQLPRQGPSRGPTAYLRPMAVSWDCGMKLWTWPFGSARSFGSPGAGGAMGYADPDSGIGYGYVTSQMGTHLTGDPRDIALISALEIAAGRWRCAD